MLIFILILLIVYYIDNWHTATFSEFDMTVKVHPLFIELTILSVDYNGFLIVKIVVFMGS